MQCRNKLCLRINQLLQRVSAAVERRAKRIFIKLAFIDFLYNTSNRCQAFLWLLLLLMMMMLMLLLTMMGRHTGSIGPNFIIV
jgi:hypothetical protein